MRQSTSPSTHARTERPSEDAGVEIVDREASRYNGALTGWARVGSIAGPLCVYTVMIGIFALVGTNAVVREKVSSLAVFTVSEPPPPEPAPPTPPVDTPPKAKPDQQIPEQTVAPPPPAVTTVSTAQAPAAIAAPPAPPTAAKPVDPTSSAPAETGPIFVSNPTCTIATPVYPTRAKRLQQTGTVRIAVTIDATGRIVSQTVRKSSGFDALDQAAIATVRAGKCRANAEGRAVNSILPVSFTLDK